MTATTISHEKDMHFIMESIKDIAESVMYAAEGITLEEVLQRIAEVTRRVTRARYVALGVPDEKGELEYFKVSGIDEARIRLIGAYPKGDGLLGAVMRDRETLRLERMTDDPRSVGFPKHHPAMTSFLGVPIQVAGGHLFGILYLSDREDGKPFDEQDQWLVETLAGYAALAIAGVELSEKQQRVVLLEERERVAMDLHDGVIQSLYAIGMQLQLMRLANNFSEQGLSEAVHNLDDVIGDIRRYIHNLRLRRYEQKTVRGCLNDILLQLHAYDTVKIYLDAPDHQPPLTPHVFEAACQIAQEAMSNVLRHANASEVRITVADNDAYFSLIVEDNGAGFDQNAQPKSGGGLGLRNIQQRARIHGGKVNIQSTPGQGTRILLTLPVA